MLCQTLFLLCMTALSAGGFLRTSGKHFVHGGQRIFLSGANTAWVSFGHDFGNHQYNSRRAHYISLLDQVKNNGGNSMMWKGVGWPDQSNHQYSRRRSRYIAVFNHIKNAGVTSMFESVHLIHGRISRTWVHIEGQTSPKFDHNGYVTGLDSDGSFLDDFVRYLDDAHARNILIFPTLWNGALKQNPGPLGGLITDTSKLQSYIDHALIPWVRRVKDHPALGGWDIINEMEGFIISGRHNSEPCFDTTFLQDSGAGWAGPTYTAQQLLRFINYQADAIRRTDTNAQVTAGSWSQKSQTDRWGNKNLYTDHCLTTAGGKSRGTLTFYSTHTYDWQGRFSSDATFEHHANDYGLNKPLVIAEFNQDRGGGQSIEQLFNYAYYYGYAGAWSWHANADGSDTDSTAVQMRGIAFIRNKNDQAKGGLVHIDI